MLGSSNDKLFGEREIGYELEHDTLGTVRGRHRHARKRDHGLSRRALERSLHTGSRRLLDLQLSGTVEGFAPPAPFDLRELDPAGLLPERPYTKDELRTYLQHCRKKCRETMVDLTEDQAHRSCQWGSLDLSFAELLLYNMRHVQHHAAQLNLLLRQNIDSAPPWVKRTQSERPPGSPQGA